MAAPVETLNGRVDRQPIPPQIEVNTVDPDVPNGTQKKIFIFPGAFLRPESTTMTNYGKRRANELGITAHILSAQLMDNYPNPLEHQAQALATHIQEIAKNGDEIALEGGSQGVNPALSTNHILKDRGIIVSELYLKFPRGLTQESLASLAALMGIDIATTGLDLIRHPLKNWAAMRDIITYLKDSTQGFVDARRSGHLKETVQACAPLNHDIKYVDPRTKVFVEFGEDDALSHSRDVFPNRIPGTLVEILAADLQDRFFPDKFYPDGKPEVSVNIVPGTRHSGLLGLSTSGHGRRSAS